MEKTKGVSITQKKKGCGYCNNAVVDPMLTSYNDLSYCPVGTTSARYSLLFRSGADRPTALIFEVWNQNMNHNEEVGFYEMKYCPECGRKLIENK